jgi:G3E family GTPase
MQRTVVLINEFGEIGLDHLLVERVDESVVLLQSGCICCSIRDDLSGALRSLLTAPRSGADTRFRSRCDRNHLDSPTPAPILYTLAGEPVVRHHFRLANVITTVDAVNAALHLSQNPEGVKQVAAADRLVITKTDLAQPVRRRRYSRRLARLNPSAEVLDVVDARIDVERLLKPRPFASTAPRASFVPAEPHALRELNRHSADVSSTSLALDVPLDWTAFGIWLSMLLNRHGNDVLRVKGILNVQATRLRSSSTLCSTSCIRRSTWNAGRRTIIARASCSSRGASPATAAALACRVQQQPRRRRLDGVTPTSFMPFNRVTHEHQLQPPVVLADGPRQDRRNAQGWRAPPGAIRARRAGARSLHPLVQGRRLHRHDRPHRQHLCAPARQGRFIADRSSPAATSTRNRLAASSTATTA